MNINSINIGDMVKDHFGRVYIVVVLNRNNDNRVYNISVMQVAGKPIPSYQYDNKGHIRMFPIDITRM